MKKCPMLAAALVVAALTSNAQAQEELSYSYAELTYAAISDGSSYSANIQYEVKPQIYIFGGYTYAETETTATILFTTITTSTETNVGFLGGGYHMEVSPGIDAYGEVGYMLGTATIETVLLGNPVTLDTDVKGVVGAIGVRGFVMPKVEAEGSLSFGPDDFGGFSLTGRYYFLDNVSVGGGLIEGDLGIGLRANF